MIALLAIIKMFFLTILQNASFTLVSRARNSKNIKYNIGASILSNGIWLFVAKAAILSDEWYVFVAYVVGATIGSALMQWVAINYLEKPKEKTTKGVVGLT